MLEEVVEDGVLGTGVEIGVVAGIVEAGTDGAIVEVGEVGLEDDREDENSATVKLPSELQNPPPFPEYSVML